MGEAYSNLDLALKETGHLDSAVQVHKNAMELSPTDVGTLTNYGSALQAAAETESAIATFERALSLEPQQHGRQDRPGDRADGSIGSQSRDRNFRRVIVDGVALGDELPEHALAHKNLGLSLELKGEYEAGIRHDA